MNYEGPIDLTQYFVQEISMEKMIMPSGTEALKINMTFSRRVLSTFLTVYLPTFLLCIVCFSTNSFKPFFFEAVVTVNLTSLLVLTTLFVSVSNSLPTTAYVKMIDVWLLFCLFIPFLEVILHTYMDTLREDMERNVNHHGKVIKVKAANDTSSPLAENVVSTGPTTLATEATKRQRSITRDVNLVARYSFFIVRKGTQKYKNIRLL